MKKKGRKGKKCLFFDPKSAFYQGFISLSMGSMFSFSKSLNKSFSVSGRMYTRRVSERERERSLGKKKNV
jgi:hypothetical protein